MLANALFPAWLVTITLIVLLLYVTFTSVRKAIKLHRAELRAQYSRPSSRQHLQPASSKRVHEQTAPQEPHKPGKELVLGQPATAEPLEPADSAIAAEQTLGTGVLQQGTVAAPERCRCGQLQSVPEAAQQRSSWPALPGCRCQQTQRSAQRHGQLQTGVPAGKRAWAADVQQEHSLHSPGVANVVSSQKEGLLSAHPPPLSSQRVRDMSGSCEVELCSSLPGCRSDDALEEAEDVALLAAECQQPPTPRCGQDLAPRGMPRLSVLSCGCQASVTWVFCLACAALVQLLQHCVCHCTSPLARPQHLSRLHCLAS